MKELPVRDPRWVRFHALWAELHFRQQALWRLYPDAKFRSGHGGGSHDVGQPSVYSMVLHDNDSHGVVYDHEMTLLIREIDKVQENLHGGYPMPEATHPIVRIQRFIITALACACDEATWEANKAAWEEFVEQSK